MTESSSYYDDHRSAKSLDNLAKYALVGMLMGHPTAARASAWCQLLLDKFG